MKKGKSEIETLLGTSDATQQAEAIKRLMAFAQVQNECVVIMYDPRTDNLDARMFPQSLDLPRARMIAQAFSDRALIEITRQAEAKRQAEATEKAKG